MKLIEKNELNNIFELLKKGGFTIIGPALRDNAIVYDEINSIKDFPEGWTDDQDGATYRLERRDDKALFGYATSPQSWKKFLFPSRLRLMKLTRKGKEFKVENSETLTKKYAFIGVRSCDLEAIFIQDKVFKDGEYVDPYYNELRKNVIIIAVNCTKAGGTCFCVSMKTGPAAKRGYDLVMTEVVDSKRHYFLIDSGSEKGNDILNKLPHREANKQEINTGQNLIDETSRHMRRKLDTRNVKELLYNNLDHPQWDDVSKRCLTCTNCTLVCPTCFCSTVEDVTDLSGDNAERWRRWDSCFSLDYSKVAGGNFRSSARARYRQWMTHKLASWIDQFGTSGCVGCGRCITWCPVGIDITAEVQAIRNNPIQNKTK
jgi:sulfhydrogenase subunit beta (sulfur reductase)